MVTTYFSFSLCNLSSNLFQMPVSSLKEKIANEVGIPVGQQRLIFRGKVLKDDHNLSVYCILRFFFSWTVSYVVDVSWLWDVTTFFWHKSKCFRICCQCLDWNIYLRSSLAIFSRKWCLLYIYKLNNLMWTSYYSIFFLSFMFPWSIWPSGNYGSYS